MNGSFRATSETKKKKEVDVTVLEEIFKGCRNRFEKSSYADGGQKLVEKISEGMNGVFFEMGKPKKTIIKNAAKIH